VAVRFPQKEVQVPLFEVLSALPAPWRQEAAVLIGDFNCGIPFADSDTAPSPAPTCFRPCCNRAGWMPDEPRVKEVRYLRHLRQGGLSDHSALVVESGSECVERLW
jgi:hypothetical protein